MGFDTTLDIGDRTALIWRKHASAMPRMLFRWDQAEVSKSESGTDTDRFHAPWIIEFRSTALEVLETLEHAGMGWDACVAAYRSVRYDGFADGMVMGRSVALKASKQDTANLVEQFRAMSPAVDLSELGKMLAVAWASEDDQVPLFEHITYDGSITDSDIHDLGRIFLDAVGDEGLEPFAAMRAAMSWALLYRDAQLFAWPMLVCILLRHLPPGTPVTLDLTEDGYDQSVETEEDARDYLESYWSDSAEYLVGTAETLARLLGVLASFESKMGQHFWFARAAERAARLKAIAAAPEGFTSKERGDALEDLADSLIRTEEPELTVIRKNYKTSGEEIDLLVSNSLADPFWVAQQSPLIFVECKNQQKKSGVDELRNFEGKMADHRQQCHVGIFVATAGFTKPFMDRLSRFQTNEGIIFAITGDDLDDLIANKTRLTDWLRTKGVVRALGRSD